MKKFISVITNFMSNQENSSYSENYLRWVKIAKEKGIKPLTRSQYEFAEFCLKNHKQVGKIGDMLKIFNEMRDFIKNSKEFIPTKIEENE